MKWGKELEVIKPQAERQPLVMNSLEDPRGLSLIINLSLQIPIPKGI